MTIQFQPQGGSGEGTIFNSQFLILNCLKGVSV